MCLIYIYQLGAASSQHNGQPYSLAPLLDTINIISSKSVSNKYCIIYLMSLVPGLFFFLGKIPNYSHTIHPPWLISFVVKVVNIGFNTPATVQHQMWVVHGMSDTWVLTIYWRLHNIKWQIPTSLTTYYLGQKEENVVLTCEFRSEDCIAAEKSHSTKTHSPGVS